ncbi:hypothetical protein RRF57_010650 [Xylaria bambusicola]|uniref:Uncharacterized protein n=1 Tax=Xylaria bambusicola TaxID=326684 RepID=A0AAN7UWY4_9PEZI
MAAYGDGKLKDSYNTQHTTQGGQEEGGRGVVSSVLSGDTAAEMAQQWGQVKSSGEDKVSVDYDGPLWFGLAALCINEQYEYRPLPRSSPCLLETPAQDVPRHKDLRKDS